MVSTSGSILLDSACISSLIKLLVPRSEIITPNVYEAREILKAAGDVEGANLEISSLEDFVGLAKKLKRLGSEWVLLKGGHIAFRDGIAVSSGENASVCDILTDGMQVHIVQGPFSQSKNTHGTGCSLACMMCHCQS